MARPLILPKYFDQEDFRSLYKKYGTKKYGIRLLAMHYLQDGKGVKETAALLVKTEFTIRDWILLYSEGGIDGLLSIRTGRGRKPKLSLQDESNLRLEINELSDTLNGGRVRAVDIQDLLETRFNAQYSQSGVYALLHRLGYSWITSRSIHPKSDKALQESFKK